MNIINKIVDFALLMRVKRDTFLIFNDQPPTVWDWVMTITVMVGLYIGMQCLLNDQ